MNVLAVWKFSHLSTIHPRGVGAHTSCYPTPAGKWRACCGVTAMGLGFRADLEELLAEAIVGDSQLPVAQMF